MMSRSASLTGAGRGTDPPNRPVAAPRSSEGSATVLALARIETPVGLLLAIASHAGLCGLPFLDRGSAPPSPVRADRRDLPVRALPSAVDRRLRKFFGDPDFCEDRLHAVIALTREWLAAYFDGRDAPLPPLDLRGQPFECSVWAALLDVAPGTTCSYGTIAKRLGNPGACRAVGLANGANPVPLIVPCHRIIGVSGTLTGYGGGLERKAWLLAHERRHWGENRWLL